MNWLEENSNLSVMRKESSRQTEKIYSYIVPSLEEYMKKCCNKCKSMMYGLAQHHPQYHTHSHCSVKKLCSAIYSAGALFHALNSCSAHTTNGFVWNLWMHYKWINEIHGRFYFLLSTYTIHWKEKKAIRTAHSWAHLLIVTFCVHIRITFFSDLRQHGF